MQCEEILQLKLQADIAVIKIIHVNQCMGIQESRLRACIYGSHFAYKKFARYIQNFQDRETLMAEKELLLW